MPELNSHRHWQERESRWNLNEWLSHTSKCGRSHSDRQERESRWNEWLSESHTKCGFSEREFLKTHQLTANIRIRIDGTDTYNIFYQINGRTRAREVRGPCPVSTVRSRLLHTFPLQALSHWRFRSWI